VSGENYIRRGIYRVLVGKSEGMRQPGRPMHRWKENIKMHLLKVRFGGHELDQSGSG
jgi:hypothetical protein